MWLLTVLIGLTRFEAGLGRFQHGAGWHHWLFESWGYPPWFCAFIGAAEIVGAVLLLWPLVAS